MRKRLAKTFQCPTEFTLQVLGGKWKTVILSYLKERPLRYNELRRLVPTMSQKMLTARLHDLVDLGLVSRMRIGGVEHYILSATGMSLRKLLTELYNWGETNATRFGVTTGEPLAGLDIDDRGAKHDRLPRNGSIGRD